MNLARVEGTGGFTLLELMVAMVIVAILVALTVSVTQVGRARGQQVGCVANLRQIGVALQGYLQDHQGELPPMKAMRASTTDEGPTLDTVLADYAGGTEVFRCPADRGKIWERSGTSYWWYETVTLKATGEHNYRSITLESFFLGTSAPSQIPLVLDKEGFHPAPNRINALYADGRAGPLVVQNPNVTP